MKAHKRSSRSSNRSKNIDPILFEKQEAEANKKKAQLKKYENAQLSCLACSLIPELITLDFTSGLIHINCIIHKDSQISIKDYLKRIDKIKKEICGMCKKKFILNSNYVKYCSACKIILCMNCATKHIKINKNKKRKSENNSKNRKNGKSKKNEKNEKKKGKQKSAKDKVIDDEEDADTMEIEEENENNNESDNINDKKNDIEPEEINKNITIETNEKNKIENNIENNNTENNEKENIKEDKKENEKEKEEAKTPKKILVKEKHIIINLDKNNKCENHISDINISFCANCSKNICSKCINEKSHSSHNILNFQDIIPNQKEVDSLKAKFKSKKTNIINQIYNFGTAPSMKQMIQHPEKYWDNGDMNIIAMSDVMLNTYLKNKNNYFNQRKYLS